MAGFEDDDAPLDPVPPKRPGKRTEEAPATDAKSASVEAPAVIEAENLVALVDESPIEVLKDEGKRNALYGKIRALIAEQKPDLSTQAGRDRIKSFVYKITRTRTALDAAGKDATAEMRAAISAVNDLRNDAESALKLLEAEARKPLTEWEEEQERQANARKEILQRLNRAALAQLPAPDLKDLQIEIETLELDPALWGEDLDMVTDRRAEVVALIDAKIVAAEAEQRARLAEAELEKQRSTGAGTATDTPAVAEPVVEQRELPPRIDGNGAPAAATAAKTLTPTQQARRLVLPVLLEMKIPEETARALILAIEAGKLPGVVAAYMEPTQK